MRLYRRAVDVIPGGIYGHHAPASVLPGMSPYYASRAEGAYYWDVDGRRYIDYMCGYGPNILGYGHPEVEEAAEKQRRLGDCMNHPTSVMVDLAELLVEKIDFAHWAVFGKNGSDMTTWSIQLARAYTGRKKILCIAGAYHGTDAWCTPGHAGLIEEDRQHIHTFSWNDTVGFSELFTKLRDQIAAVILTPYHHPIFADQQWGQPEFLSTIESSCREHGALLILDDIRAGFRLNVEGSHRIVGLEPDIACYCKAIANGYPLSATVGRRELKNTASKVFLTGSYWNGAVAMAAAMATLRILEREDVPSQLEVLGNTLMQGLEQLGDKHGLPLLTSGPPAAPFFRFEGDTGFRLQQRFCALLMEQGVFLHPHHNGFLCAAHTASDIAQTLHISDDMLKKLRS